ncbi:hypothetical protein ILYODFUR_006707 [Ilyodon furcidens]|uniref:Secreted protein n=1 Tax=Ilyodon furcidens TaxID=33524 RepID=A0ABV0TSU1_9TELE
MDPCQVLRVVEALLLSIVKLQAQQHMMLLFLCYRMREWEGINIPPILPVKAEMRHVDIGHTRPVSSVCPNQNEMIGTTVYIHAIRIVGWHKPPLSFRIKFHFY